MKKNDTEIHSPTSPEEAALQREAGEITRLLRAWAAGDKEALGDLMGQAIHKLRATARAEYARRNGQGADCPTELVSYVWERLQRLPNPPSLENSRAFYAYCGKIIRHLLIDGLRQQAKKGLQLGLDDVLELSFLVDARQLTPEDQALVLELLERLAAKMPEHYQAFINKIVLGFTDRENADILGCSVATLHNRLAVVKTWLRHELAASPPTRW